MASSASSAESEVVEGALPGAAAAVVGAPSVGPSCRLCGAHLEAVAVDLGMSPLCESFLRADQLDEMEPFFPLRVYVCEQCWLVQLMEYVAPATIFTEYAYFSSYSDGWLDHARTYAERMTRELGLTADSRVVELGSNDGYLLQYFRDLGVGVLGIEPAANVAAVAEAKGIPSLVRFFGLDVADELVASGVQADLIAGNNVLAQVPDLNGFIAGIARLLAPDGLVTIEVPHLLRLIEENQFDTIYHEHFSYFSLNTVRRAFERHGLEVTDVEELPTHGGSLRIHGRHAGTGRPTVAVRRVLDDEAAAGLESLAAYASFQSRVEAAKAEILTFLIAARAEGKRVAGYGAPGKANTFLNFCGIRTDLLAFTVDRNPYKHGRFTPGTHIPIHPIDYLEQERPDVVWILPWNLRTEIAAQLAPIAERGGRFLVAIPHVELLD